MLRPALATRLARQRAARPAVSSLVLSWLRLVALVLAALTVAWMALAAPARAQGAGGAFATALGGPAA